tara:strand:+ start:446 stop:787 length:342 start_codon:yes stop_codon:yes gene_type:complete
MSRRNKKKFNIYEASPGLENTEKYGTKKYSSKKKKELKKLYNEFLKLHNKKKLKSYDVVYKKGKNRTWKIEGPTTTTSTIIQGKNRNFLTKKNKSTIKGVKRSWTLKNRAKSK